MRHRRKVIAVTDAGCGLGRLSAIELARRGHLVYATMPDTMGANRQALGELCKLARRDGLALRIVELDLTDLASVRHSVRSILLEAGRLDVLLDPACPSGAGARDTIRRALTEAGKGCLVLAPGDVRNAAGSASAIADLVERQGDGTLQAFGRSSS